MEQLILLLEPERLYPFILLFARVVTFMALMPVFGHVAISVRVRVALSFYLSIFLYPTIEITTVTTEAQFLQGLLSEVLLGVAAAFIVNLVFAALRIAGDLISYATALSMATMFDPASGTQDTLINRLFFILAVLLFFESGIYEVMIILMAKSFDKVALGGFSFYIFNGIDLAILEMKRMMEFAFSIAFPLFFISFIMDIFFGYATRSMPQFSVFVVTFQLKFALVFIFMLLSLNIFFSKIRDYFLASFT